MRKWIFLLVITILAIFQVTLLDYFKIFGVKPDLLLISIVIISLCPLKPRWILFFSIFAGILKDALTISTFGINTLLFPLWSLLIIRLSKKISLDNNFIRALLIYIISVFNSIMMKFIFLSLGKSILLGIFLRITFLESLYTALVLPLLFIGLHRIRFALDYSD